MPRQEQFLTSGLPDASDPSSRHSQQLEDSAGSPPPSGLMAKGGPGSVDVDDDMVQVDVVTMERPQEDIVGVEEETSQGEVARG